MENTERERERESVVVAMVVVVVVVVASAAVVAAAGERALWRCREGGGRRVVGVVGWLVGGEGRGGVHEGWMKSEEWGTRIRDGWLGWCCGVSRGGRRMTEAVGGYRVGWRAGRRRWKRVVWVVGW